MHGIVVAAIRVIGIVDDARDHAAESGVVFPTLRHHSGDGPAAAEWLYGSDRLEDQNGERERVSRERGWRPTSGQLGRSEERKEESLPFV
jgi:hypothetical protein